MFLVSSGEATPNKRKGRMPSRARIVASGRETSFTWKVITSLA
jgi:hypothetical protein